MKKGNNEESFLSYVCTLIIGSSRKRGQIRRKSRTCMIGQWQRAEQEKIELVFLKQRNLFSKWDYY